MPFQSVPDTAAFTAHFTGPDGTRMSFTLYSRNTAAPWDATQLSTMAEALADAIDADYMPAVSSDFTFINVTGRDLEAEFGRVHEGAAHNTAGGIAVASLPANVAVRATFIGEPGAAPRRGGINLLPPTEAQVVGNIVQPAALALLETAVASMAAAVDAGTAAHAIVSRYSGTTVTVSPSGRKFREPVKRVAAVTNTVNDIIVKNRVDSQRKRRPKES
jgi:hypothetical protein